MSAQPAPHFPNRPDNETDELDRANRSHREVQWPSNCVNASVEHARW